MKITENNIHDAEAISLLLEQFRQKTKIGQMLSSVVQEVQTIEAMLYSLWDERTIDTAVGTQLDIYGTLVGQVRTTGVDSDYRRYIKGRIAANKSFGRIPELLNILTLISDSTDTYTLSEHFPAAIRIEGDQSVREDSIASFDDATYTNSSGDRYFDYPIPSSSYTPAFVSIVTDLLGDAKGAGIGANYTWSYRDLAETFTLSSQVDTIETSSLLGLANGARTTGGHLQGVST